MGYGCFGAYFSQAVHAWAVCAWCMGGHRHTSELNEVPQVECFETKILKALNKPVPVPPDLRGRELSCDYATVSYHHC